MRPRPYALSAAYLAYARGLRELHRLEIAGRSNSAEADEVRDTMDLPWQGLGETEAARADGLSEDLYSISDPPHEPEPMNPQAQSKLNEFYEAREAGDWDRALALLRRWAKYIPPALLAFLRGTIWQRAGDPESAALFYERAHRLDPEEPSSFAAYLDTADPASVRPEVDRILERPAGQPLILLTYAIKSATRSDPRPSSADYRRFATILEAALNRPDEEDSPHGSSWRPIAYARLGLCLEMAGDSRAAMEAYTRGLAIAPDHAGLLAARGLSGYGASPSAVDDLERAIRKPMETFWPFFFLAHHRLSQGRLQECLRLCDNAQQFDVPDFAGSVLAEWTAIARARLEFPPAMVREAFEEAVRLDPSNERARHNRVLYEERLASPREESKPFEARTSREVRASVPPGVWFQGAA